MRVSIRGVDKQTWEDARIQAIKEGKTMGQMVNEGLQLRQKQTKANKNSA